MKINEILKKCNVSYYVQSIKNFDIKGISFDSKTIKENFIFAVVKGFKDDGEKYIKDLKKFKNIGIVVREGFKTKKDHQNLLIIRTKNVRELAGEIASLIYPNTINEKIAITGTNGKTSISHYIAEISSNQKISNCIFMAAFVKASCWQYNFFPPLLSEDFNIEEDEDEEDADEEEEEGDGVDDDNGEDGVVWGVATSSILTSFFVSTVVSASLSILLTQH